MAWNGWKVIDMDSHVTERPHEMYGEYIESGYRDDFERLKLAILRDIEQGGAGAIASSRRAAIAPGVSDNPLGGGDGFGLVGREFILHPTSGRKNFGRPERGELPLIRKEASWDVKVRLEDMDLSYVDIDVIYPTHVSSYCALRDIGFENALYEAYHRWISDFCSQAPDRLKWTLVVNMRDPLKTAQNIAYWSKADPNLVGIYMPPNGPDNMLLDDRRLYPVYQTAQEFDLPILIHGGTGRPPYQPGTFDLQGTWFLQHGLSNPWAGMAAMGAIVGGGIMDRFDQLRVAVLETAAGWLPAVIDRFDAHYVMSPNHTPELHSMPSEVIMSGRYFHGIDTWERSLEYVTEFLGEDVLLFATDWPHGDTAWPSAVDQVVEWAGLNENAKRKILGENALRLCPRILG